LENTTYQNQKSSFRRANFRSPLSSVSRTLYKMVLVMPYLIY